MGKLCPDTIFSWQEKFYKLQGIKDKPETRHHDVKYR